MALPRDIWRSYEILSNSNYSESALTYLFNRILDNTSAWHKRDVINEKDQRPMQGGHERCALDLNVRGI